MHARILETHAPVVDPGGGGGGGGENCFDSWKKKTINKEGGKKTLIKGV